MGEKSFQEQGKSVEGQESRNLEKPVLVKEKSQLSNAADHSLDDPSKSAPVSDKELASSKEEDTADNAKEDSQTSSQQHVPVSDSLDVTLSRENVTAGQETDTTIQSQEQTDQNVFEDVLFEAGYTPRPVNTSDTSLGDGEKPSSKVRVYSRKQFISCIALNRELTCVSCKELSLNIECHVSVKSIQDLENS